MKFPLEDVGRVCPVCGHFMGSLRVTVWRGKSMRLDSYRICLCCGRGSFQKCYGCDRSTRGRINYRGRVLPCCPDCLF